MKTSNFSYIVDAKFTIEEAVESWESVIGDVLFRVHDGDDKTEAVDFRAQVLTGKPTKFVNEIEAHMSGGAKIADLPYGVCLGRKDSKEKIYAAKFLEAALPDGEGQDPDHLFLSGAYPLTVSFTRNVEYEHPYFIISLHFSHGVFGGRYSELLALSKILRDDLKFNGPSLQMEKFAKETEELGQALRVWEDEIVDFDPIRAKLSDLGSRAFQKFSKNHEIASINWDKDVDGSAVDMPVGKASSETPPLKTTINFNKNLAFNWCVRLGYGFEMDRAIAFWKAHRDTDPVMWDAILRTGRGGWKATWPALAEILTAEPIMEKHIDEALDFLADPNWPGFGEVWNFMVNYGEAGKPMLEKSIQAAKDCKDDWWEENLQYLHDRITGVERPD
jgi:hypothetical protein